MAASVLEHTNLKLEDCPLSVEWYTETEDQGGSVVDPRIVLVTGLNPNTSTDTLSYFLENKRRSGGGPIISIDRKDATTAEVTFENVNGEYIIMMLYM